MRGGKGGGEREEGEENEERGGRMEGGDNKSYNHNLTLKYSTGVNIKNH